MGHRNMFQMVTQFLGDTVPRMCSSIKNTGILVIVSLLAGTAVCQDAGHPCLRTCETGKSMVCKYDFTIEWYRTLSKACYDCPFNKTDCFRLECVAADGKIRPIMTINRQIPGPAIIVCEGDDVEVVVQNLLEDGTSTSIHWHGQHMRHTPYMDGTGQITQCNIHHQEQFTYRFKADPAGTHWYHSHTGMQLADGIFGPLIVRQPANQDPNSALYDLDLPSHTVLLYDWLPELAMSRYLTLMHDVFDVFLPRSVLINGRGRGYNVTNPFNIVNTNLTHSQTPLEVFIVRNGTKYRFRFIGVSPVCPLHVSVDKHNFMVIAVDGMPLKPRLLDAFIIHPGERYDFVLIADQVPGSYWMRVIGIGDCEAILAKGLAIIRYEGYPDVEPSEDSTYQQGGILLNPILFDGNVTLYGWNRSVVLTDEMESSQAANYTQEVVDFTYTIGMDFNNNDNSKYNNKILYPVQNLHPLKGHYTPVMDNITFNLPPIPVLSQPGDVNSSWFCNRSTLPNPEHCFHEDLCMCTHLISLPLNKVVELIVFHEGRVFTERGHNMHLHGHSFRLLGLGKLGPSVMRSTIEELDRRGQLRRKYISPSIRDTVNVPDGGYAIIRFNASNPGFWIFHCHTDSHLQQGMALLFKVGESFDLPPLPADFPRCGGMGFSNARQATENNKGGNPCSTIASHSAELHTTHDIFVLFLLLAVGILHVE